MLRVIVDDFNKPGPTVVPATQEVEGLQRSSGSRGIYDARSCESYEPIGMNAQQAAQGGGGSPRHGAKSAAADAASTRKGK